MANYIIKPFSDDQEPEKRINKYEFMEFIVFNESAQVDNRYQLIIDRLHYKEVTIRYSP